MRIRRLRHEIVEGCFRQSTVDLEYGDGLTEQVWFRVPEEIPPPANGNAWLATALPLAAVLGEDLSADMPVDPWLRQNAETLVAVWRYWHPKLVKPIRIHAETTAVSAPPQPVVSMFTAGIDSFFTVFRHPECRHYVNVLGFDMPIRKQDAYGRLTAHLERAACQLGARLLRMATNLRETRWGRLPWEGFASGAALSGALLQLEGSFGAGLIPSSELSPDLPWGTHPLTDPLFSSSSMRILHDGLSHTRMEKTAFVSQFPVVQENLHVCFVGRDTHGQDECNCSRCEKCTRTMLMLDILGVLQKCMTFDLSAYRVAQAGHFEVLSAKSRIMLERLKQEAERRGRHDIAHHLNVSLRKSRLMKVLKRFEKTPALWRLPHYYRRLALGGLARLNRLPPGEAEQGES